MLGVARSDLHSCRISAGSLMHTPPEHLPTLSYSHLIIYGSAQPSSLFTPLPSLDTSHVSIHTATPTHEGSPRLLRHCHRSSHRSRHSRHRGQCILADVTGRWSL